MRVKMMTVGVFQSNCFIVSCEDTSEAIIIDAGDEGERIVSYVSDEGLRVKMVVNTHAHIDHVCALSTVVGALSVPVYMHERDAGMYEGLHEQAAIFGLPAPDLVRIDRFLRGGDKITVGKSIAGVIETPGHSPGGISLLFGEEDPPMIFVGDVLFRGSIGRTDLLGADHAQMLATLKDVIMNLSDDTVVFPGHGPETTIGLEKRTNPFLLQLSRA